MDVILYGTKGEKLTACPTRMPGAKSTIQQPFEGIVSNLERRYRETQSDGVQRELEECMSNSALPRPAAASGCAGRCWP